MNSKQFKFLEKYLDKMAKKSGKFFKISMPLFPGKYRNRMKWKDSEYSQFLTPIYNEVVDLMHAVDASRKRLTNILNIEEEIRISRKYQDKKDEILKDIEEKEKNKKDVNDGELVK